MRLFLNITQGLEELKDLRVDAHTTYTHSDSIHDFQESLACVISDDLLAKLRAADFFSIMLDESTDVSVDKTLIIYIRVLARGQVETHFLEVTHIEQGTAAVLLEVLMGVLEKNALPLRKMAGIATDGAAAMTGCRSGLTTRLKQLNPYLVATHCIAHRLALASSQAAHTVPFLRRYQEIFDALFKYFHYSSNHLSKLKAIQRVLNEAELTMKVISDTRWLSFHGAVSAVLECLGSLNTCLVENSSERGNPAASGLLKAIARFDFIATTHFLVDALTIVNILSLTFQKKNLDFTIVQSSVNAALSALKSLQRVPGTHLAPFLDEIPEDAEDRGFTFRGHHIKDDDRQRSLFSETCCMFLKKLDDNLRSRFPDGGITKSLSILDPKHLPPKEQMGDYGRDDLEVIILHFGEKKTASDGTEHDPLVCQDATKEEWLMFKHMMSENYRKMTIQEMWALILQDYRSEYPNLCTLATIALTIPVATVDCERGFSTYNLIKTKTRNCLKQSSVHTLMLINLEGPSIENFDFQRSFRVWSLKKKRRIMAA